MHPATYGTGLCAGFFPLVILTILSQPSFSADVPAQTIRPAGTTVTFAQTMDWFDATHFAIGRWDGTISLFRIPGASEFGPVVTQAMALPSGRGVEMLTAVDDATIVSSDGSDGLAVWHRPTIIGGEPGKGFELAFRLPYDQAYGAANSGLATTASGENYLITGHENGNVLFWHYKADGSFELTKAVNVQSPQTPANPWGLRNVRGLAAWRHGNVITGSEDGDVVGLNVPDGQELFRLRYNATAQRGINNISVADELLLVANCAVGSSDKNLWLFDLSTGAPVLDDAENLAIDLFRSQVFDFDTDLAKGSDGPIFFSSTEEGLLWMGRVDAGQLIVSGVTKSSAEGGSIMDVSPGGDLIAVATNTIRLFKTK